MSTRIHGDKSTSMEMYDNLVYHSYRLSWSFSLEETQAAMYILVFGLITFPNQSSFEVNIKTNA